MQCVSLYVVPKRRRCKSARRGDQHRVPPHRNLIAAFVSERDEDPESVNSNVHAALVRADSKSTITI